jgi:hypothetical protein
MKSSTVKKFRAIVKKHPRCAPWLASPFCRMNLAWCVHPKAYWCAKFAQSPAPEDASLSAAVGQEHASVGPSEFQENRAGVVDNVMRAFSGEYRDEMIVNIENLRQLVDVMASEYGKDGNARVRIVSHPKGDRLTFIGPMGDGVLMGCKN